jgi:hypothetical protein
MTSLHHPHAQPNRCFYLYTLLGLLHQFVFPAHLSIVPACLLVDPGSPILLPILSLASSASAASSSYSASPIARSIVISLLAASFSPSRTEHVRTHEEAHQQRILHGLPSNNRSTSWYIYSSPISLYIYS